MKKLQITLWCRKTIVGIGTLAVISLLSMSSISQAQEFTQIKIFPEHIGIFTSVGEQQFVAFGLQADGNAVNITKKVDWKSSNEDRLTIDSNGLATIAAGVTYGQVKVSASYPKTGKTGTATNLLLLKR